MLSKCTNVIECIIACPVSRCSLCSPLNSYVWFTQADTVYKEGQNGGKKQLFAVTTKKDIAQYFKYCPNTFKCTLKTKYIQNTCI